jgi:hypothetical protein
VGLKHFAAVLGKGEFKLQLLPLTAQRNIFLEDPAMKQRGLAADLKGVTVVPEYEISVRAAAK